jgi:hypothetical protein
MAYQPIHMPQPDGLGGIAEFIMQARRQAQQEEHARADLLLRTQQHEAQVNQNFAQQQHQAQAAGRDQQRLDQAGMGARMEAARQVTAALDSGRPDLAKQIAHAAGIADIAEVKSDPRDALMMPSFDAPTQKPQAPPDLDLDRADRNSPQYDPGAVEAHESSVRDYETQLAGYHPGKTEYEFGGMRPVRESKYRINGEEYDPLQVRMANEARRGRDIEQVRGAFGPLGYGDEAAALAGANTQDRPIDVSKLIATRMERDNAREATRTEKETNRDFVRGENEKYRNDGLTYEQREALARIGADAKRDSAGAVAGPRQDQGDLQSRKYVDETITRFEKNTGVPKLLQTMEMFKLAKSELKKPSGAAQVGARMAIERALRGGPPTQYMDEQEQKHLSGVMGRLEGLVETLQTGQFGDEQKQAIDHEIDAAISEFEGSVDRRYQAAVARFKGDPAYDNLQGTVNGRIRQMFAAFGRQVPDVYPGGKDRIGAIGSRSVAGSASPAPKPETVGLTDNPNDESPLPEDPNAEELPEATKATPRNRLQDGLAAQKAKGAARANTLKGGPTANEAQVRDRARKLGMDPEQAVSRARAMGILQ